MSTIPKTARRGDGLVTQKSVAEAAEALARNGETVSVRKVIAALGGGSPNAVLPLLQAWKAALPTVQPADITLDPRLVQILAEQITFHVADARRKALEEAEAIKDDAAATAEAGRVAEARVEELTEALEETNNELQQHAGRIAALQEELEAVKKEAAAGVAAAKADAQREREDAEKLRQALARAELKLEAMPAIEADLKEVRAEREKEVKARTEAEKSAAVAGAQRDAAIAHAHSLEVAANKAAEAAGLEVKQIREELVDVRKQLEERTKEIERMLREATKKNGEEKEPQTPAASAKENRAAKSSR